jgi:hypothetical protein
VAVYPLLANITTFLWIAVYSVTWWTEDSLDPYESEDKQGLLAGQLF